MDSLMAVLKERETALLKVEKMVHSKVAQMVVTMASMVGWMAVQMVEKMVAPMAAMKVGWKVA